MDTLLQRARRVTRGYRLTRKPDPEKAELAVAWALGEITLSQAGIVAKSTGAAAYSMLAGGLRDAVRLKLLVVRKVGK